MISLWIQFNENLRVYKFYYSTISYYPNFLDILSEILVEEESNMKSIYYLKKKQFILKFHRKSY